MAIGLAGCSGLALKLPPLHDAAREGNLGEVKRLVEAGTDVNELDDRGDNALYWAMLGPNWRPVSQYLITKGIDVNNVANDGYAELDRLEIDHLAERAEWLRSNGGHRVTRDTTKAVHARTSALRPLLMGRQADVLK